MPKLPFIFHDVHDSQPFAMAQAAGRAGFPIVGILPHLHQAPWVQKSIYFHHLVESPSLGDINQGQYALAIKKMGIHGVFVPLVDDIASLLAEFAPLLRKQGLRFLSPHPEQIRCCDHTHLAQWQGKLGIPATMYCHGDAIMATAQAIGFPLILKSYRDGFIMFEYEQALSVWLDTAHAFYPFHLQQRLQRYIPGETTRMASVVLLFDQQSRPIRGFTARRIRVAQTQFGPFGETLAAHAETIPDLYDAVLELMQAMQWVGFAEIECKQDSAGRWHLLEINPRLSGWSCFAEADGAGFLQAYYHLCTEDKSLSHACLQRNQTQYSRIIASSQHRPDWHNYSFATLKTMLSHPPQLSFGAWDKADKRANQAWAWWMLKRYLRKT